MGITSFPTEADTLLLWKDLMIKYMHLGARFEPREATRHRWCSRRALESEKDAQVPARLLTLQPGRVHGPPGLQSPLTCKTGMRIPTSWMNTEAALS